MKASEKNQIPEEYQAIAHRLRVARGHISQAEVGKSLGIHKNTIGNYERGERLPDVVVFARLCKLYGVTTQWVLTGTEHEQAASDNDAKISSREKLDPAQWLVEDVIENYGIALGGQQKQAVIDVLRKFILTQTRALISAVKIKNEGHSRMVSTASDSNCYYLKRVIGFSDAEFEAWLRANYGVSDCKHQDKDTISDIAGHLYDIAVERCGADKVEQAIGRPTIFRPGDEGYNRRCPNPL